VYAPYTNGWLTGITAAEGGGCPGTIALATLSYYPNTMVNQVAHANGVTDTYGKDPNDMARPASVCTSGAATNWITGTYQYDGPATSGKSAPTPTSTTS